MAVNIRTMFFQPCGKSRYACTRKSANIIIIILIYIIIYIYIYIRGFLGVF